jgi:hypothetical protein
MEFATVPQTGICSTIARGVTHEGDTLAACVLHDDAGGPVYGARSGVEVEYVDTVRRIVAQDAQPPAR